MKAKRMHRFAAGLLAVVMLVMMLPVGIFAADTATVWDFSAEDFTGEGNAYNGLTWTNGQKNKTYLLAKDGTVSVPVSGPCDITVSACYQYSFYFENDGEASVGVETGSTSQIDSFTYSYNGEAGTVDVTVLGTSYLTKIEVTPKVQEEVPELDSSKIDVWDFGAEALDSAKYNNMLTVDEINSWFPGIEPGTSGTPLLGFTSSDGQLKFEANGKTNNRLRTTNEALCRHDSKSLTDASGNVYTGYVYSNSSSTDKIYLGIKAYAGDIITLVVGSNGGNSLINFAAPSGNVVTQEFLSSGAKAQIMTFYAAENGMYKIYSTTEKLVVARIYREHTEKVTVSGSVSAPETLSGYSILFTNDQNGDVVEAPVENGTYSAKLNDSYSYTVSLKNANGYIIVSEAALTVEKGAASAKLDVEVIAVEQVTVSGSIVGLPEDALAKLSLSLQSDAIYKPAIVISGNTYTVSAEVGVTYTLVAEGINDYTITSGTELTYTEAATSDIVFEAKPVYAVTIAPEGATAADLAAATFTFTNLNEEGYVYSFTGTEGIALRDGVYSVKVTNSGAFVQQLTSNLKVAGAAVTKTVPFSSDITEWDFSNENFTGEGGAYNTLTWTNGQKNKTYLLANTGTVSVPVKGSCQIVVSACYQYSFYFESETEASVDQKTGSTGQIDAFVYNYNGGEGTVDITVLGQSYLTKIEIVDVVEYKSTVTVGASGCDYTTINAALDAVAAMSRPNNERVTISIQPGNYEEMLVINVPNVTLKNASSNPSIELTNKGVGIAKNAVRITSYYGHGYTYYSMGSDCKYDETILKVNKENGYASFTNPGTGTTAGSYWNATVVVMADGFRADGIIFENSFNQYVSEKAANDIIVPQGGAKEPASAPRAGLPAGSTAVQDKAYVERAAALAIGNNCTEIFFDNCKFIGRQDTLYGGTGTTAAFYDCSIYGACDYIFGGMTAVFAKCDLVFNTSENGNDVGYITAAQTPANTRGMLMYNCTVTSTVPGVDTASEFTSKPGYFGRPWAAATGEAVFYNTVVEASDTHWYDLSPSLIRDAGWLSTLSGESALCGEYGTYEYAKDVDNSGKRAAWASVFETETLADGKPISVETFLGSWDAFAGKDMTVVIPTEKVDNAPKQEEEDTPSASVTYVLDTTADLAALSAGAKADGDVEKAGTDGYFAIYYSAKTKIDGSKKTFEDAYEGAQRLNFGGKASIGETIKNAIQITTANKATVKVWFVQGGDDNRQVAIFDAEGNQIAVTALEGMAKNSPYIATLEIPEAGTYFIGCPVNNNNFYRIEVTEEVPVATTTKEYVLDTTADLAAMSAGAKADGDVEKAGTDGYFSIYYSAKTKIDGSKKTFEDAYEGAQRLNFGGKAQIGETTKNAIQITTAGKATVTVWFVQGGDDNRQVAIFDAEGNQIAVTALEGMAKNSPYIATLEIPEAGTYFIGCPVNNNNFYKIVVAEEVAVSEPKDYILDTTADLAAMSAGAKADGDVEKAGTEDFFSIYYSAKTKIDGSKKTFEDAYEGAQRLNFGGKAQFGETIKNAIQITVDAEATVKVWFVQGGDDNRQVAIFDAEGNQIAVTALEGMAKNSPYIATLEIPEAGTYFIGCPVNNNNFYKIQVTVAGSGSAAPERADWAGVEAPAISAAADNGEGEIEVTVNANVGFNGGDEVIVTLFDAAGNEIATKRSIAEKAEHTLTFAPTASGEYTLKVTLNREGEESKNGEDKKVTYVLPLEVPAISSATSEGDGKISVVWSAVPEATAYEVYCDGQLVATVETTSCTVSGLTVGQKYSFTVVAVRGEEKGAASEAVSATATANAQTVWGFTIYGPSTNEANNGYEGSINETGSVTVYSEGGKGKIQPNADDGLAFYYTAIPTNKNFTLRATVHVDSWDYSNGQEGFGLLATDALAPHRASSFLTNQFMAAATKMEYRWSDGVVNDSGTKYTMRLGLGVIAKLGRQAGDTSSILGQTYTLETYAAQQGLPGSDYNIVGNVTNPETLDKAATTIAELTDFVLEIQKNNTGYFITYYDLEGNIIGRYKGYDPDALSVMDTENVYVGFFAARRARATFSNVVLKTIDPSEDAPAEEKPVTKIEPSITINSAANSNSSTYNLSYVPNVAGTVTIYVGGEVVAENVVVIPGQRNDYPVELPKTGKIDLKVVFTPDPDQDLGEDTILTSTDPVTATGSVTYSNEFADQHNLYVSPKGSAKGSGYKDNPLDIYTAVKYVQAGQTIILMEGTYKLDTPVRIEHGIDGTMETPIRMVADPEAKSRPVLDFQGKSAGIVHGGDYWYFQGFDVTRSANGQKGFQVSGHYNVLDSINTYHNGNSGVQISRFAGSDPVSEWPSYNLILNCTSYGNADAGYEDADGFAAKLTCGEGNVFDGCVAYNNADDGWDLYAKPETGPIGVVTIRNCVAFANGYLEDGTNAGNGNGFKLGGSNIPGGHKLINSYAFFNKSKGIDSNSCPDVVVENCITYNNERYNVAFYTNIEQDTNFRATGIISFKDDTIPGGNKSEGESFKPKGSQDPAKYLGDTNYYWDGTKSTNASGKEVTADWFVSLEFKGVKRNADGTIDMQGFLELTESAAADAGARPDGMASGNVTINPDPESDPSNPGAGDLMNPAVLLFMMMAAMVAMIPAAKARKNA